jgi:glucose-6-phosphate 1-epimerase
LWRAEQGNEHDECREVSLSLPMAQVNQKYWPHESSLKIVFKLSDTLEVSLINTNLGNTAISFTQALHTYFPTSDISQTHVDGLQGAQYIEFGEGPFAQNDTIHFTRETDMVYNDAAATQKIITPEGTIRVERKNSTSCVLWNPWIDKAQRLSNFQDNEYKVMLCLEAANVKQDQVVLSPGDSHSLTTIIAWQ